MLLSGRRYLRSAPWTPLVLVQRHNTSSSKGASIPPFQLISPRDLALEDAGSAGDQGVLVAPYQGMAPWLHPQVVKEQFLWFFAGGARSYLDNVTFQMADTPGSCRTNGQDGQRSHWVWIKVTLRIVWIASDQFSIVLAKQITIAIDRLQGGLWVWLCGWNKKWGDCRVPGRGKSTTLRGKYLLLFIAKQRWTKEVRGTSTAIFLVVLS